MTSTGSKVSSAQISEAFKKRLIERVELEKSIPERVAALEERVQTLALALVAVQTEAMTPAKVIDTIDKMKAG